MRSWGKDPCHSACTLKLPRPPHGHNNTVLFRTTARVASIFDLISQPPQLEIRLSHGYDKYTSVSDILPIPQ